MKQRAWLRGPIIKQSKGWVNLSLSLRTMFSYICFGFSTWHDASRQVTLDLSQCLSPRAAEVTTKIRKVLQKKNNKKKVAVSLAPSSPFPRVICKLLSRACCMEIKLSTYKLQSTAETFMKGTSQQPGKQGIGVTHSFQRGRHIQTLTPYAVIQRSPYAAVL